MKRIIALLSVLTIVFLSACGNTDVIINNNLGDTITENGITEVDVGNEVSANSVSETSLESSENSHIHMYTDATCTSPKTCKDCGATEGNALGHNYSPATCVRPQTCTRCGEISGEAGMHNYENNICTYCGKTDPDSRPTELNEVYLIDSYRYEYKLGTFTDSFGNKYNGVHYFTDLFESANGNEPHAMFNLKGQYKTFSGSIVASPETEPEWSYYINIYVDGVLTYSKTGVTKTTGKVDFEIDVSNAETLEIRMGLEGNTGDWNQELGIVNAQLEK